ncbi:MAG: tRNA lysidine(34) synthetase TilS, partial [Flavobacteriales bacterium]|nr:tRNA lysidine(34) synthetase TilS [Flavobacteriales bacterium]
VPVRLLIHQVLRGKGFHPEVIEDMREALEEGRTGASFLSATHQVHVDRGRLLIERTKRAAPDRLLVDQDLDVPVDFPVQLELLEFPGRIGPTVWLDPKKLRYPLEVRRWRPGDRMRPAGGMGSRKISDLLIDAKVPMPVKERTYVVISDGTIVLLVGQRAADGYEASIPGEKALRFHLVPDREP